MRRGKFLRFRTALFIEYLSFFLLFSALAKKMVLMISRNDGHHCTPLLHRFEQAISMSCQCRLHENLNRLKKSMFIVILFTSPE